LATVASEQTAGRRRFCAALLAPRPQLQRSGKTAARGQHWQPSLAGIRQGPGAKTRNRGPARRNVDGVFAVTSRQRRRREQTPVDARLAAVVYGQLRRKTSKLHQERQLRDDLPTCPARRRVSGRGRSEGAGPRNRLAGYETPENWARSSCGQTSRPGVGDHVSSPDRGGGQATLGGGGRGGGCGRQTMLPGPRTEEKTNPAAKIRFRGLEDVQIRERPGRRSMISESRSRGPKVSGKERAAPSVVGGRRRSRTRGCAQGRASRWGVSAPPAGRRDRGKSESQMRLFNGRGGTATAGCAEVLVRVISGTTTKTAWQIRRQKARWKWRFVSLIFGPGGGAGLQSGG